MRKKSAITAQTSTHAPVLLQEVIEVLSPIADDVVVDCTLGGGGHADSLLARLGPHGRYLAIDLDKAAIERAEQVHSGDDRLRCVCGNFRAIDEHVRTAGVGKPTKILLDLGLSSDQLTAGGPAGRGFSFAADDQPLLMTLSAHPSAEELTAAIVVNEWDEETLALIIHGFGNEHQARRIARAIVEARRLKPFQTSKELADAITKVVKRRGAIHPATKTFQAIRMAVNDELGALEEVLEKSIRLLAPGGRVAVITFHSLEDGLVKRAMLSWERKGWGSRLLKHPIIASRAEVLRNRRARSAKLRCFEKLDQLQ